MFAAFTRLYQSFVFYLLCLFVVGIPTWSCVYLAFVFKAHEFSHWVEAVLVILYIVLVVLWALAFALLCIILTTRPLPWPLKGVFYSRPFMLVLLSAATVMGPVHTQMRYAKHDEASYPTDTPYLSYMHTGGYAWVQIYWVGSFVLIIMGILKNAEKMYDYNDSSVFKLTNSVDKFLWTVIQGVCAWFGANGVSDDRTPVTEYFYLSFFFMAGVITLMLFMECIASKKTRWLWMSWVLFGVSLFALIVSALADPYEHRLEFYITSIIVSASVVISSLTDAVRSSFCSMYPYDGPTPDTVHSGQYVIYGN